MKRVRYFLLMIGLALILSAHQADDNRPAEHGAHHHDLAAVTVTEGAPDRGHNAHADRCSAHHETAPPGNGVLICP